MTESDIDILPDDVSSDITSGPGERLKSARKKAGLSISEVAERLHIGEHLIDAIERDDHAKLPGPVFTKGYLRNYARLVNEPVDEILLSLPEAGISEETRPALRQFKSQLKTQQVSSSHGIVKTITWLVVLGLIVMVVVWWRGYLPIPTPGSLLGTESAAPVPSPVPVVDPSADAIVLEQPVTRSEASETESPAPAGGLPVFPDVAPPAIPTGDGDSESIDEGEEQPRTGSDDTAGSGQLSVSDEVESDLASVAEEPQTDGVVFNFSAPCWVDIRDSNGTKVLYGGIGGGERHILGGQPPYKVVLGDASSVSIVVNGQTITPPSTVAGKKVARFSLDPDEYGMVSAGLRP